jgi:hypothetical protein
MKEVQMIMSNQGPITEVDILRMNVNNLEQQLRSAYMRINELRVEVESYKQNKKKAVQKLPSAS